MSKVIDVNFRDKQVIKETEIWAPNTVVQLNSGGPSMLVIQEEEGDLVNVGYIGQNGVFRTNVFVKHYLKKLLPDTHPAI